jgi:hypothetical protein
MLLTTLLLTVPLQASQPALPRADARIGTSADVPRADGPGFEVAFHPRGPVVQPVYGADAPDAPWLGLELEHVARGTHVVATGGAVEPLVLAPLAAGAGASGVAYDRGAVTELYEPLGPAIEQSFVLGDRPGGAGDLVVRLRLTGPLADVPHRADRDGGLVFARADLAQRNGVRIGSVTGVGADGARCAGELRRDGAALELVLPAAFVDAARYPLVVDPLIGTELDLDVSADNDSVRDVGIHQGAVFLVVYERHVSASDVRLRARMLTASGIVLGGTIFLGNQSVAAVPPHPRVAGIDAADKLAVVWVEEASLLFTTFSYLRLQPVDASTGAVDPVVTLAVAGAGELSSPDVAGPDLGLPDAVVVYREMGAGLRSVLVTLPPAGAPSVSAPSTIVQNPFLGYPADPAISSAGSYLAVAYRNVGLIGSEIRAVMLDWLGQSVAGPVSLTSTSDLSEIEPEVDGNGQTFVAAWSAPQSPGASLYAVRAAPLAFDGTTLSVAPSAVLDPPAAGVTQRGPRVALTSGKALIAYAHGFGDLRPRVIGIDAKTLGTCESPIQLNDVVQPADLGLAASTWPLDPGKRTLCAYSSGTGDKDVHGQLFDGLGPGGNVVDLGGGCGPGGTATAIGPAVIGNASFRVHVAGVDPAAPLTVLNLAFGNPTPLICGPCAWTPFHLVSVDSLFSGGGGAVLPIPCDATLVGADVHVQFTTPTPAATPCPLFPGFSLSNRLRVTVGP